MTVVTRRKLAKYAGTGMLMLGHCLAFAAGPVVVAHPAEDLFLRLGRVGLDSGKVYHVREAHIDRPGFSLTLDDGTIGFTEDVLGRVTGAIFEGEGMSSTFRPLSGLVEAAEAFWFSLFSRVSVFSIAESICDSASSPEINF